MYFLLLLVVVGLCVPAKAVLVNIPDANFRARLQVLYPACFVGVQMETTCVGITSATSLIVNSLNIANLSGLEYFTSLQTLNCSENFLLTSLPALPSGLKNLVCGLTGLTTLPTLPTTLLQLSCSRTQLTNLPNLPTGLQTLWCPYNKLASLPSLPVSLTNLDCSDNPLGTLLTLPANLQELTCLNNQLTSLPTLPTGLRVLACGNNPLGTFLTLLTLPAGLRELTCFNNQLASLPTLPAGLQFLSCGENPLGILLPLPTNLQILSCNNNELTNLPTLPSGLLSLDCRGNQLTNLPALPSSGFQSLNCRGNQLDFADLEAINPKPTSFYAADFQSYKILPATQTINIGSPVTINGAIGGSLNQYQWYKFTSLDPLSGSTLIIGATNAILSIPAITFADAGKYRCEVKSTFVGAGTTTGVVIKSSDVLLSFSFDPTTSIDNSLSNLVKVSPNPSNGDFSVDFSGLSVAKSLVRVYDAQGKTIFSSNVNNSNNLMNISLKNVPNGIYLLQISTEKGNILKRIVKAD